MRQGRQPSINAQQGRARWHVDGGGGDVPPSVPEEIRSMPYNRIVFSGHALQRMRERRISEAQVIRTIDQPDSVVTSRGALVAERRTAGGNTLRVVYREQAGEQQVISAVVITAIRIAP
jgi:hypothetical protein